MTEGQLPQDVTDFLARYIPSIGHLDTLIFVYERRHKAWTVSELSYELRTNDSLVQKQLQDLSAVIGAFDDIETARVIGRLCDLNRTHKHALISTIYNRQLGAIRSFSDAFKINKEEKK